MKFNLEDPFKLTDPKEELKIIIFNSFNKELFLKIISLFI